MSRRFAATALLAAALACCAPPLAAAESLGRAKVGEITPSDLATPHPYPARTTLSWEVARPGATYIKLHMARFELAPGDVLEIASPDGRERYTFEGRGYKNKGADFWVNSVLGDRVVLRLQSVGDGAYGFDVDSYAYGTVPLFPEQPLQPESVCGAQEWQDVACYETSHPIEYDRARRAVVVLYNGFENCTGVKVGCPNQFLTNEHCVTSQADVDVTEVRFEYQNAGCNAGPSDYSVSYLGDQFVDDDTVLDYCLFTAEGASDDYEAAEIDARLPDVGERLYISGHPAGSPKKLSIVDDQSPDGLCRADFSPTNGNGVDTDVGYFCDTTGGSSGSPVWSGVTNKLIALHHFGGCPNSGVRMDLIDPLIEGLLTSCCDLAPGTPTLSAAPNGDNRIDLAWDDADLPTVVEYVLSRSRTPGGPYTPIATIPDSSPGMAGGAGYSYVDWDVSGGTTYSYVVESDDGATCRSDPSPEAQATATGACTLPPIFAGVGSVAAPQLGICTLEPSWSAATPECGGPVSYNVYRSTLAEFEPGAGNLVASGIGDTSFVDVSQLVDGTPYTYIVRAVDEANAVEDANTATAAAAPTGSETNPTCTTASSCADNPFVDVTPEGPLTVCLGHGPMLTAELTGGAGPFSYQWIRDGIPVDGATVASYTPDDLGTHTYNVRVSSASCPDEVFDGLDTQLHRVDRPFFAGIGSAVNPQEATCRVELAWAPATTVCDGPIGYAVYRDTVSPVVPGPATLLAGGLTGTGYSDTYDLVNEQSYHYLVQALDLSTGNFDGNAVEATAAPDGPGNGANPVYVAPFDDAAGFSSWTVTTGPGPHSCGEWALSTSSAQRPTGSAGSFIVADSNCQPVAPRTSTSVDSPAVDLDLPALIGVGVEADVRYGQGNGDDATIEVWDGAQWVVIWSDPNANVNQHLVFDVTAQAAGNPAFRVRLNYQNANADMFFAVDNVQVIAEIVSACDTAPAGPPSVPRGSLAASRQPGSPGVIDVSWDATTCTAADYNLLYGDLAAAAATTLSGAVCSLGATGSYAWSGAPAGDLFFLVVGTDGAGIESSWGRDSSLAERHGSAASGMCGAAVKLPTNVCP